MIILVYLTAKRIVILFTCYIRWS